MKISVAKAARSRRLMWAALGLLIPADVALSAAPTIDAGEAKLDFCAFSRTFTEDFDRLSVASRNITGARWIAHTPWNGDFGDAVFTDPGQGFPFDVEDGILTITARKGPDGKWRSGLLASADSQTRGFSQKYGYFEARAQMPHGSGIWPAFWLSTSEPKGRTEPTVEVDVIEYYGHDPAAYQSTLHVWHKNPSRSINKSNKTVVPRGSLADSFHTYGVKVAPKTVTFYLDRKPIWQQPTPPEHKEPLLLLVNLALGSGYPIDKTPNPSVMKVDYIHAYALEGGDGKNCPGK